MQMVRPFRRSAKRTDTPEAVPAPVPTHTAEPVPIPDHDPLMGYLLGAGGPVDIDKVELDSPALHALREAEVHLVVPLISQGELIGTLNLGRRLSEQPYSTDDRKLLRGLASQVAPAIRLAQLVQQQEAEAQERERIEQELRVAALIQQTLLPKELPDLPGWEIDAYYRPARAVGGDFYDFIPMSDGRLGLVIGDVTDKGVPAALVMATTRSTLRAAAQRFDDPGAVLAETNEVLVKEIPPAMFVTCLFGVLEPSTGKLTFANAGHNLPYVRTSGGVIELRATGMPLGLMPGMPYDVETAELGPDAAMLLTSDGIVEAHAPDGSMFGFDRLKGMVGARRPAGGMMAAILSELDRFCGPDHEQEDDVTMVAVKRITSAASSAEAFSPRPAELEHFSLPSEEGNERVVMERVARIAAGLGMNGDRLERLKTAVSEASMNAIEHGNGFDASLPVDVTVLKSDERLIVRIVDHGSGPDIPDADLPDIDAKLAGLQSPRGWGLFLIEEMVDTLRHNHEDGRHVMELEMALEGAT
jgi:serine phosphatase RsbU (regulator of sigma subunit)/anti-sigma regulatory factor (Ser/Thr protein kinase)